MCMRALFASLLVALLPLSSVSAVIDTSSLQSLPAGHGSGLTRRAEIDRTQDVAEIVVDGYGHVFGPLTVVRYGLTEPTGEDFYPLGTGVKALYGLLDTGSTKVRINNGPLPNRLTGPNWGKTDAEHLALYGTQSFSMRLNGIAVDFCDGDARLGLPGGENGAQVVIDGLTAKPEQVDVTLIGAPVLNRLVASIDYANMIRSCFTGIESPDVVLYRPGDASIPRADIVVKLATSGAVSTDGVTAGKRYWLTNTSMSNKGRVVVADAVGLKLLLDTGTTGTLINDKAAAKLGLVAGQGSFNCYGGIKNGYYLESVSVLGDAGLYKVNNTAVCWSSRNVKSGDVVVGSNLFDQVWVILDGPNALLGIKSDLVRQGTLANGDDEQQDRLPEAYRTDECQSRYWMASVDPRWKFCASDYMKWDLGEAGYMTFAQGTLKTVRAWWDLDNIAAIWFVIDRTSEGDPGSRAECRASNEGSSGAVLQPVSGKGDAVFDISKLSKGEWKVRLRVELNPQYTAGNERGINTDFNLKILCIR